MRLMIDRRGCCDQASGVRVEDQHRAGGEDRWKEGREQGRSVSKRQKVGAQSQKQVKHWVAEDRA